MAELAAIGLASNLLQFAEYGVKLFVLARSIYKSGSISENEALEAEAWRLARLAAEIRKLCKKDKFAITRSELRSIASECDETAQGLIEYLNKLDLGVKTGDKVYKKVWTSLAQALRHMTHSGETKSFETKLGKLQAKLRTYLAAAAARNQVEILDIVKGLKFQNAKLETQTTEKLEDIVQRIESTNLDMRKQQADEFSTQLARLKKEIFDFAEETNQVEKKQRILQSLRFVQMRDRQNAILPHHEATFNWIFEHHNTTFPKWLESEGDIFWIRGKPGSGKSTLMKFLAGHPTTKAKLQCWGGEKKVVMASHYFWNAGNSMQKSQRGLLQTLLFEVLRELPDLIEMVCGDRWDASDHIMADPWEEAELVAAFNELALKTENDLPTKFCFFIDGLDEYTAGEQRYHGMFDELLQTLYKLVSLPGIKICASSRPWDAFDLSLGPRVMEWRLQVEDLTRGDIKKYVKENLEGNNDYKELAEGDSRFSQIASIVVNRAQGVFLWVYLIVRSLIRGLAKADTYEELLARLNKLPSDLGDYFRHMLESIESNYWENTSRIFRIMIASGQALPLLAFEFLDREEKNPNYALQMDLKSFPLEKVGSTYKRLKKRVEARGRDLLHISEHSDKKFLQFQVDFLHRTVRDFFRDTGAMDQTILLRETNEFSPLVSLCRIMLACGKALPYPDEMPVDCNQVFLFADGLMYYAWRIEDECNTDAHG
ncbi:uncharacterized protein CTRU02_207827 [Colletotrichum truncatum]|uniref:Uncharacterized protein n=1 Tax=Colletotrichum truncatum TaxID=5467 RepID=A0ACC3Z1X3_COLTU|nr:uncharacterized protein CTRU02_15171 [Colletotrichum truncatum]KAF6781388.1 hypothetical protein CTRU02_15171 [Colletotrichum truncatum]